MQRLIKIRPIVLVGTDTSIISLGKYILQKVPESRGVAFLGSPRAKKVRRRFCKELSTYNIKTGLDVVITTY